MTTEEFTDWKKDFRTVVVLTYIRELRRQAQEAATDPSLLLQNCAQAMHARYVGMIEGFDAVLNASFEEDQDEVTDNHD